MKPTKKFWLSIFFGFTGLGLSLLRFNVVIENFRISLHWGFVFPLMIAIAYGSKYGLISGVLGLGAFFPFFLWPENGYANLLAFFLYLLLYVGVGYTSKIRRENPRWWNHYFLISFLYSFFLSVTIYSIYPILVSLNPPPWNGDASLAMSQVVALSIATKVSVEFFSGMMIAFAFVKTNTLRKILGVPKKEEGRSNERTLGICLLLGLSFWLIYGIFDSIFVKQTFPYQIPFLGTPEAVVVMLVFLLLSFMISIVAMEYLEKQFILNVEREKTEYELKQANIVGKTVPQY